MKVLKFLGIQPNVQPSLKPRAALQPSSRRFDLDKNFKIKILKFLGIHPRLRLGWRYLL